MLLYIFYVTGFLFLGVFLLFIGAFITDSAGDKSPVMLLVAGWPLSFSLLMFNLAGYAKNKLKETEQE